MTTIAYRDGVIAADTGMHLGGSRIGAITKIARNAAGDLAGAAGDACYCAAFRRWFAEGEIRPVPAGVMDAENIDRGVIFRRDGSITVYEPRGPFDVRAPYYAFGSGRPEALGAMFAGANAETAVRAAMAHDNHTCGDVIVLRHTE